MSLFFATLFASVAILVPQLGAPDTTGATWPPIPCGRPCVIEGSPGGIIDLFIAEANDLKDAGTPVIVDGPCISACTLLVDIDRANVCLTTNAAFGFHQSSFNHGDGTVEHGQVSYETPGLDAYIKAHGGEPNTDATGHILVVPFGEMKKFYRPCDGAA